MALSSLGRSKKTKIHAVRAAGLPDRDPVLFRLALAQMPARLREARKQFRNLTGLTAVMSLRIGVQGRGELRPLSPPIHPQCAERLRTVSQPPCDAEWQRHLRTSQSSQQPHTHICSLGLRCSCVPIYLVGSFIGVAKLVADSDIPASDFSEAVSTLALTVSLGCHESYVSVLQAELQLTRQGARAPHPRAADAGEHGATTSRATIVDEALDYLHRHHDKPDLSLRMVAASLGYNGRYLTHLFTQVVGQRMHTYLVGIRVERACRELLQSDRPIKQIAYDAGFSDPGQLVRAFHRHVGVTPGTYREIFTGQ